jgi:hypothetical protein
LRCTRTPAASTPEAGRGFHRHLPGVQRVVKPGAQTGAQPGVQLRLLRLRAVRVRAAPSASSSASSSTIAPCHEPSIYAAGYSFRRQRVSTTTVGSGRLIRAWEAHNSFPNKKPEKSCSQCAEIVFFSLFSLSASRVPHSAHLDETSRTRVCTLLFAAVLFSCDA